MPIPAPPPSPAVPAIPGQVIQSRWARIGTDLLLGAQDDYGTKIWITDMRGWEGALGTTSAAEQRAGDDGAWLNQAYMPARVIQMDLTLRGTDFATVTASLRRLTGLIPHRSLEPLLISDHGFETVAQVRQESDILTSQKGQVAKASLSLLAPDPRRYSATLETSAAGLPQTTGGLRAPFRVPARVAATVESGIVQVTNAGTTDTPPTLTVYGPVGPFTLTHRGTAQTLRFHEAIDAGRYVVLDTVARTALLDGIAPRYITGSWFTYPPGVSEIAFNADTYSADALFVSEHRHAWK